MRSNRLLDFAAAAPPSQLGRPLALELATRARSNLQWRLHWPLQFARVTAVLECAAVALELPVRTCSGAGLPLPDLPGLAFAAGSFALQDCSSPPTYGIKYSELFN